jgi:hypothetical protein
LLDELRKLSEAHDADSVVQNSFAIGLVNASQENDSEKAEQLLGELRAIYQAHREEAIVREMFAMGLLGGLARSQQHGNQQAAERVWRELRALFNQHQDDSVLMKVKAELDKAVEQASAGQPASASSPST